MPCFNTKLTVEALILTPRSGGMDFLGSVEQLDVSEICGKLRHSKMIAILSCKASLVYMSAKLWLDMAVDMGLMKHAATAR